MTNESKFSKNLLRKNRGAFSTGMLTRNVAIQVLTEYKTIKNVYRKNLFDNLKSYQNGKLTDDEFTILQQSSIKNAFNSAYELGKRFSNNNIGKLDDGERRSLIYMATQEINFMKNFADNIKNQSGRMPYQRRMKMYVDGLDAIFGLGKVAYLPEDITIYWRLGITDKHCLDCLSIVANNPYTKKTLPGYPKSGDSECLSNCRCHLEYIYNNSNIPFEENSNNVSSDYDAFLMSINLVGKDTIPTRLQFEQFKKMVNNYYFNRLSYEIDKDINFKNKYLESLKQITNFKKSNNLKFDFQTNISNILKEFKLFKNHKNFTLVKNQNELSQSDLVSVFYNGKQIYGKIISTISQLIITTIEQIQISPSFQEAIIFKWT